MATTFLQTLYAGVPSSLKRTRSSEEQTPEQSGSATGDILPAMSTQDMPTTSVQLPGLAALASLAQVANDREEEVEGRDNRPGSGGDKILQPATNISMSYATAAPGQPSGVGAAPPICQNCETSTTPLWRRDESGTVLCNACGLFFKLHGRARPISLKTDVIKSRNRVKPNPQGGQKKQPALAHGLAAAHPDVAHGPEAASRRAARQAENLANNTAATDQPISRSDTPSFLNNQQGGQQSSNIAPQHMFDASTLDPSGQPTSLNTPYITHAPAQHRNASPSALSFGTSTNFDSGSTYSDLATANTLLKTRVSELEVINDLFRGRVAELETGEAEARRQLDDALRRERELKSRLEGLGVSSSVSGDADEDETANEDEAQGEQDADRNSTTNVNVNGNGHVDGPAAAAGAEAESDARQAKRVKTTASSQQEDQTDANEKMTKPATRSLRSSAA